MYNDVRFTLNGKPMVYTSNLRRLLDVFEDYGLRRGSKSAARASAAPAPSLKTAAGDPLYHPLGSIQGAEY